MRGELVNDSQKLQNLGCLDEAEDQLEALLNSTITIMDSNAMKSQGEQSNVRMLYCVTS